MLNLDPFVRELEASVRGEEESRLFYEALAGRATRGETRALAEGLAREEEAHRETFLRQFEGQVDRERALAGLDPAAAASRALDPSAAPSELLRWAVDKERESEVRYKFLAEQYAKTPHWVLFLQLSESEREHKSRLQRELDRLAGGLTPW